MPALTPAQRLTQAVRRALLGPCALPASAEAGAEADAEAGAEAGAEDRSAPATGLLVACSGGPDSTALLLALASLQGELGLRLHAVYVDHGLRAAAADEGRAVLALCEALEVPAQVVSVAVPPGASLQGAARRARYQALVAAAQGAGLPAVAVAHTASDQAETMLMRLLQGAGLRGLAAMAARRRLVPAGHADPEGTEAEAPGAQAQAAAGGQGDPVGLWLLRPLLSCTREEVLAFLMESGVETVADPSNQDPRYLRSRLRHQVLPLLRREHPTIERRLGELAESLRLDAELLEEQARSAALSLRCPPQPGERGGPGQTLAAVLDAPGLGALARPLGARVVLAALGPLPAAQVSAVLALCAGSAGTAALDLAGGRRAERRYQRLLLFQRAGTPAPLAPQSVDEQDRPARPAVEVRGPGTYQLGDVTLQVVRAAQAPAAVPGPQALLLPAARLPLWLRAPRPGDRIALLQGGHQRVSDLLINAKVPRSQRPHIALLCSRDDVLWVVGLRVSPLVAGAAAGGPADEEEVAGPVLILLSSPPDFGA